MYFRGIKYHMFSIVLQLASHNSCEEIGKEALCLLNSFEEGQDRRNYQKT